MNTAQGTKAVGRFYEDRDEIIDFTMKWSITNIIYGYRNQDAPLQRELKTFLRNNAMMLEDHEIKALIDCVRTAFAG